MNNKITLFKKEFSKIVNKKYIYKLQPMKFTIINNQQSTIRHPQVYAMSIVTMVTMVTIVTPIYMQYP